MSVYGSFAWNEAKKNGCVSIANMKATTVGHIYDVVDSKLAVENGTGLKLGAQVAGQWNVFAAETAAVGDKLILVGTPALLYPNYTTEDQFEWKFINAAGTVMKCYEIVEGDRFGISDYSITPITATAFAVGQLIVTDGSRKWKALAAAENVSTYGFVGEVAGFETHENITYVLVRCLKNETVTA